MPHADQDLQYLDYIRNRLAEADQTACRLRHAEQDLAELRAEKASDPVRKLARLGAFVLLGTSGEVDVSGMEVSIYAPLQDGFDFREEVLSEARKLLELPPC
jgi:hypothetical protein